MNTEENNIPAKDSNTTEAALPENFQSENLENKSTMSMPDLAESSFQDTKDSETSDVHIINPTIQVDPLSVGTDARPTDHALAQVADTKPGENCLKTNNSPSINSPSIGSIVHFRPIENNGATKTNGEKVLPAVVLSVYPDCSDENNYYLNLNVFTIEGVKVVTSVSHTSKANEYMTGTWEWPELN